MQTFIGERCLPRGAWDPALWIARLMDETLHCPGGGMTPRTPIAILLGTCRKVTRPALERHGYCIKLGLPLSCTMQVGREGVVRHTEGEWRNCGGGRLEMWVGRYGEFTPTPGTYLGPAPGSPTIASKRSLCLFLTTMPIGSMSCRKGQV